ncbi:bifunctional serine/threonine-protein kinase/ABC transporter substrate-binding protein [Nocardiopsis sp. CNT312]|uniref:bifunctional serine/threonine-protein kinase/ABC transporter substrate-binding protein n=1 Tax=Nocardiopsis sp. CNT312 TaxID=1137268 RepID=UPI0004B5697C|nr:bifunctional serine/threonine-protein kinase/ABC transporter substrate-binding protein [Nocardiopsis sp. CNT312]
MIPPFEIHGRLGSGRTGIVYAAKAPDGRWSAVRVIHPEHADDPGFRQRFSRLVQATGHIRARSLSPVLSGGPNAARPWIATAYHAGPSLAEQVQTRGPLPEARVRVLAAGMAEALAAIHAAGGAHHDLKPSNVILSPDGPKVVDYGIAQALDGPSSPPETATPWTAPELLRGRGGPESDVFAWGALVVYAATGTPPFGTGPAEHVSYRLLHEEPDLRGLPDHLWNMVGRALAKDPWERSRASDLVRALTATGPGTAPATPEERADAVAALAERDWAPFPDTVRVGPSTPAEAPPRTRAEAPGTEPDPFPERRGHRGRRRGRTGWVLGAAAGALLLVSAVGGLVLLTGGGENGATAVTTDDALTFGLLYPQNGALAAPHLPVAAQYAIDEINTAGGVLGAPVPDVHTADEGDASEGQQVQAEAAAVEGAQRLLADGAHVVLGPTHSALATHTAVTGKRTVQCAQENLDSTADIDDGGYYFSSRPGVAFLAQALGRTIADNGHGSVAILMDESRSLYADALAASLDGHGVSYTYLLHDGITTGAATIAGDAAAVEADAFAVLSSVMGPELVQALARTGGETVPPIYLDHSHLYDPAALPDGVTGVARNDDGGQGFRQELAALGADAGDLRHAPYVFDCVTVAALAAQAAGSTDPAVFVEHMARVTRDGTACEDFASCRDMLAEGEEISYRGASGRFAWDGSGSRTFGVFEVSVATSGTYETRVLELEASG